MNHKEDTPRQESVPCRSRIYTSALVVAFFCATTGVAAHAQTFTKLTDFSSTNTEFPSSPLVQGTDGNFYGTTYQGTGGNFGSVFNVNTQGVLKVVYGFTDGNDGAEAVGVILASDGNFYGTTQFGGTNDLGTVFKVTPQGTQTTLYNFSGPDGAHPSAGVIQGSDGDFYGTTTNGGTSFDFGTVFKITSDGTLTTLHRFHHSDGKWPNAALVQGNDGKFYGTTSQAGASRYGTVFSISPGGRLTTLHSFVGSDGKFPDWALVQANDGSFYGTAFEGGNAINGVCPFGCGTIFKITPAGGFTGVYTFCPTSPCMDGIGPGGLLQATDGNFYGVTLEGGQANRGVLFKLTPAASLTTLYSFCTIAFCPDGALPGSPMVQGTDGNLYGTTPSGGDISQTGTVFRLSTGLAPFVKTVQSAAKIGSSVVILGSDLTGASRVTFHGTTASFTVVSPTEITATVPAGAATGTILVVTPNGTLRSNVPFRVIP